MSERKPFRRFKKREPSVSVEKKVEMFILRNSKSGFFTKISTIPYKFEISESKAWDIVGELMRRENLEKLRNVFYEKQFPTRGKNEDQRKQFAKEDSGKMIATEIEKLEQMLSKKRKEYDDETNFGKNLEKQTEYNDLFGKLKL